MRGKREGEEGGGNREDNLRWREREREKTLTFSLFEFYYRKLVLVMFYSIVRINNLYKYFINIIIL